MPRHHARGMPDCSARLDAGCVRRSVEKSRKDCDATSHSAHLLRDANA